MKRLTVLYDARCALCQRCRLWMEEQEALVELAFLPAGSREAHERFPRLANADPPDELVVVDDEGGVYRGSDAWILCLYALADYREWSHRLASPALWPLARAAFAWVSTNRQGLSRWLRTANDPELVAFLKPRPIDCGLS